MTTAGFIRVDWLFAAIGMLPPLFAALFAAGRGMIVHRFLGLELATSLIIAMLAMLSFAFGQASSTDLALTVALLSLPGTLVFALFVERWL
jgi:multicomponent Na+:H+ antiporter subunit F